FCGNDRGHDFNRNRNYGCDNRQGHHYNRCDGGRLKCHNCQKIGHHHNDCHMPTAYFHCSSTRHFISKCPEKESANKDKRDSYSLPVFEVMPISEGKGLTYRTNARYWKYQDKKKGFKGAHISGIDKGPRV